MRTQARLTAGHRSAKADVQYLHELWDCRTVHVDSIAEVLVFAEQRCKFIGGEIQHRVPIRHRALDDAKVFGKGVTELRNMRNNIRNMRNASALSALFPQVRQGVLAATLTQPDKWWYLSELADRLDTSPSSLQRELSSLVASGILVHRREGTRAYFKAETKSPLFRDLQQLFEKTAGLGPILEQMLKPFGEEIKFAFVYGSVARSEEHTRSDVDLMVIGKAGLADLSPPLRKAEERLGREVNVTSYSPEEFREKIKSRDHFLTAVLRGRKRFVKGGRSDLDEIVGK